jgi:hypothetical protein
LTRLLPLKRVSVIAKTPLLVAIGAYVSGASLGTPGVAWTMALTSLLWTLLYALNEATDQALEEGDRAMTRLWLPLSCASVGVSVGASFIDPVLCPLSALMVMSQAAYCLPPVRLKRWWWGPVLLSGGVNAVLRIQCGVLWGSDHPSWIGYLTVVALHVGASVRMRDLVRGLDRRRGYAPAPEWVGIVGRGSTAVGVAGIAWLTYFTMLPREFGLVALCGSLFAFYAWQRAPADPEKLRKVWVLFSLAAGWMIYALGSAPR